jgi:iron complex outermembrane receptor protein
MTRNSKAAFLLAGLVATLAGAPAIAALDEMIVTSERREGNLQEVPIAVTAMETDQLERLQVTESTDLQRYVPSLNMFNNITSPTNLSLSLRGGLQQDASLVTAESPVGIYVDDIFVGRLNGNNITLSDIERVEVLRGPQGTLYGRNTGYGAIRYMSRTPDDEFWLDAMVGAGNYDQARVKASVGGPIGDSWAGSFAAQYNEKDGQYFNVAQNQDTDSQENTAARGKIRFRGADNFDAILSASYAKSENDSLQLVNAKTPNVPGDAQFTSDDLVFTNGEYKTNTVWGSSALVPPPLEKKPRGETEQTIVGLTLTWDISDRLTLKSITGYVGMDDFFHTDFNGNTADPTEPFAVFGASDIGTDQFTQEIQLLGTIGDRISYLGGLYYLTEDADQDFGWNIAGFVPISQSLMNSKTDSISVFGESSFNFTERLKATAGLRWTEDDKDFNATFNSFLGGGQTLVSLEGKYDEWTPKVALDYLFDTSGAVSSMLLYAQAAKGFKGGGFSAIAIFSPSDFGVYAPETNWTYEGGMKAEFFDSRLRTNLAYFFSDIKDVQQNATVCLDPPADPPPCVLLSFPVQNSGDAEIQGLEFEISAAPFNGLNVFLTGSLLDGEYKNLVPGSAAGQAMALFGVEPQTPQTPDYTYTIGFDYTFDMPSNFIGDTSFGLDYYDMDEYVTAATNDFLNKGWNQLNGFVSMGLADNWELRLTGKNLADETNVTSGSRGLGGFIYMPPREYLFSVTYRYGG